MNEKELQHVGVLGMKWGHRMSSAVGSAVSNYKTHRQDAVNRRDMINLSKNYRLGKGLGTRSIRRMSTKEVNDLVSSPIMAKKLSDFKTLVSRNEKRMVLGLAVMATTYAALEYAQNPHKKITIHVDRTRWPFVARPAEPFFKATIKKVVPKLLTGG